MVLQMQEKPAIGSQTVSPQEAASITGVSVRTIYRWLDSGDLPGYRPGGRGHWRILWSDLQQFYKVPPPPERAASAIIASSLEEDKQP